MSLSPESYFFVIGKGQRKNYKPAYVPGLCLPDHKKL